MSTEIAEFEKKKDMQGMWVFIASEALLFGGLFLCLTVLHSLHAVSFAEGTRLMNLRLGTLNTAILLTSSWTLALAIEFMKLGKSRFYLFTLTVALGFSFLLIKAWEYHEHIRDGFFPSANSRLPLFFFLYFTSTGLHALHVFVGLGLILWLTKTLKSSTRPVLHESLMENVGLYWHFVDIIWVFLYPALYLIGRSV